MNTKRITRKTGFTLTEILIVLAVIVVLAAIFFPVFSRVRERGHRSVCQSNLRQIALAVQQYVQDSNGHFPLVSVQSTRVVGWPDVIMPYVKNEAIFRCPTRREQPSQHPSSDYDYIWDLSGTNESSLPVSPDHMPLNSEGGGCSYDCSPDYDVIEAPWGRPTWQPALHSGGANFSYVDGHVKWRSMQDQFSAW